MLSPAQVEWLLIDLCTKLGFCLPPEQQQQRLIDQTPDSVADFTHAVIVAEGLNPELMDRGLFRRVETMVADAFARAEQ